MENIDEIYNRIREAAKLVEEYRKIEKKGDWDNPVYRRVLGQLIFKNEKAFSGEPVDVFRNEVERKIKQEQMEASSQLYSNFIKILSSVNEKQLIELAEMMEYIPPGKTESKELEEVTKLHGFLYMLANLDDEGFLRFLEEKGARDIAYSVAGSKKLGKIIQENEKEAARNFLIGELRKLWEKYHR
jgi:hypothetical protein